MTDVIVCEMPLRTLLGYEPKSFRPRENYGDKFIAFQPSRNVLATRKMKYQAPMARVRKLPPIDEENQVGTSRQRTGISIKRLQKHVFAEDDIVPVKVKPVLTVQPIVRERQSSPPPEQYDLKPKYYPPTAKYLPPKEVSHTLVDGLVADYLHFARYGHVIPVYEGTSVTTCPCCTDRNRQNVRTLLGFPKHVAVDVPVPVPTKYDRLSTLKRSKEEDEELNSETTSYPNSMYARAQRQKELGHNERTMKHIAGETQKQTWMNYQPLPYATNYLNPEFSRPSELRSLYDTDPNDVQIYMKNRVLEAHTQYDSAMDKLYRHTTY